MRFILFGLIAVLLSCASEQQLPPQKVEAPPFYRRYQLKDRELIFIAANLNRTIDPPSQALISAAIRKFDPEIILTPYPPERADEQNKELSLCEQGERCSTVSWTCRMAKKHGIPCISGDPYRSEILKALLLSGRRKKEDIIFFYTYKSLVATLSGKKDPLEGIDNLIQENKRILNVVSDFDKYDFMRMYKENMKSSMVSIDRKNIEPIFKGNYIQNLSALVEFIYNDLFLKKIDEEHSLHKRVMVVNWPGIYEALEGTFQDFYSGHRP